MTTTQNTIPATVVRSMNALATLNTLRAAAGKPPLKVWKESRAKLDAAIEKAHAAAPITAAAPDVPTTALIAKINEKAAPKKIVKTDCEHGMPTFLCVKCTPRRGGEETRPESRPATPVLKSVAISIPALTPEQEKIFAANKAQGRKTSKKPGGRARYDWEAAEEAAKQGKLPATPDFSANTHRYYRPKLDDVVKMAKAGDVKGLKSFKINGESTSPTAIKRYVKCALIALAAKPKG